VKLNEALSYAEIPSKVCSGVKIDDGNKKLAEEIKGWMIKDWVTKSKIVVWFEGNWLLRFCFLPT
jgi:hypothetical protein